MRPPLKPISTVLRLLPDSVHAEFFSRLFNHMLQGQYITDQLVELDGKRLAIGITDTGTELLFRVAGTRLLRAPRSEAERPWDVRISGSLDNFWLLATRAEDPDTLFFNRTLMIEGETETGLYLKNLLDSLDFDWEMHLQAVLGPRLGQLLGRTTRNSLLGRQLKRLLGPSQHPQF